MAKDTAQEKAIKEAISYFTNLLLKELFDQSPRFCVSVDTLKAKDEPPPSLPEKDSDDRQVFSLLSFSDKDYRYYLTISIKKEWVAQYSPEGSDTKKPSTFLDCLMAQLAFHVMARAELCRCGENAYVVYGLEKSDILTLHQNSASTFVWRLSANYNDYNDEAKLLYENLNSIAMERYETKDCKARILLCKPSDYQQNSLILEFEEPIPLKEHRKIRKLLEIVDNDKALVSDGAKIKGITDCSQPMPGKAFNIDFGGYACWEITQAHSDKKLLLRYKAGKISTISHKMSDEKIYARFKEEGISDEILQDQYLPNLKAARDSKHGSILVFIDSAKHEATRLKKGSFSVRPFELRPENVQMYTKMDGALLIDMNCNCHALGVILDGIEDEKADSSRGARYNSAHRYYHYYTKLYPGEKCLIAVVSDDGMMDFFPQHATA